MTHDSGHQGDETERRTGPLLVEMRRVAVSPALMTRQLGEQRQSGTGSCAVASLATAQFVGLSGSQDSTIDSDWRGDSQSTKRGRSLALSWAAMRAVAATPAPWRYRSEWRFVEAMSAIRWLGARDQTDHRTSEPYSESCASASASSSVPVTASQSPELNFVALPLPPTRHR